jgi:hypothetical protein
MKTLLTNLVLFLLAIALNPSQTGIAKNNTKISKPDNLLYTDAGLNKRTFSPAFGMIKPPLTS